MHDHASTARVRPDKYSEEGEPILLTGSHARAAVAFLLCFLAGSLVQAGDMCPAPPKRKKPPPTATAQLPSDQRILIDSDAATIDAAGLAELTGHVLVHQGERSMAADSMTYDERTGKLDVKGAVDFEDPMVGVRSNSGSYDALGGADFNDANFRIFDRNGRGMAGELKVRPNGVVDLRKVRYTTCPVGNKDWLLQASSIELDTDADEGTAHNVVMRLHDLPVFYTPFISFPLGDERKSGVLFPSFGHSTTNGYQFEVPYYFNLAPNYDLTLTPGYLSARGVQLGGEFRFLTDTSHGQVEENFLPNDSQAHTSRAYVHITDISNITDGLRFDTDIASVSDANYFSDFAVGADQTSVTFLERRGELLYYDDVWRVRAQLQNFQTIDIALLSGERPYSRVPRVEAYGELPLFSHFSFALEGEATNFVRDVGPTGVRADLSPELRLSERGAWYFFEPAVGYHYTRYQLQNAEVGGPSDPSRSLPYARVDTGLIFERDAGAGGQRTQTLEPRVVYSWVPYRNQNDLPVFDTGLPDLNLVELFRTNRYVGNDRIGDANQIAAGLTTRLFNESTGTQYLTATVGQIRYLQLPRVTLPEYVIETLPGQTLPGQTLVTLPGQGNVILPGQNLPTLPGQTLSNLPVASTPQTYRSSDVIAEVALTAYKNWSLAVDYQWNPYTEQTDKDEVLLQYHPEPDKVVNLGYRFQQNIFKQYDGSFAWPIGPHWNTVGRWVYSLENHQTIEQLAGFEYKSCCWRIQLLQRRYVTNRTGGLSNSIALQLELTGLSSVGKRADAFLPREISGYTPPNLVPP
jgi:LPS-assembly protein